MIIDKLLNLIQPLAFLVFLFAGILCLLAKQWHRAWINLGIAHANFAVFYGHLFFK